MHPVALKAPTTAPAYIYYLLKQALLKVEINVISHLHIKLTKDALFFWFMLTVYILSAAPNQHDIDCKATSSTALHRQLRFITPTNSN